MKTISQVLSSGLVFLLFMHVNVKSSSAFQSHAEQARPSVVQLVVTGIKPDDNKPGGEKRVGPELGSGFVVHHERQLGQTFLFTAAHVIGRLSDWLLDDNNKPKDRTIQV